VSDTNELLELLATRGTPRGADVVLAAARADARTHDSGRGGGGAGARAGDLEVLDPDVDDLPPPAVNLSDAAPRGRRRPWRTALTAGGLAAMLGVFSLGIASFLGEGGADSPEGAVRRLADAMQHEDPLAAVDVIAPDEVRTLHQTVDAASARAAEVDLVRSASAPLAGLDVSVDDLQLTSEELAPGFAKVTIVGGRLALDGDVDALSDTLRRTVSGIAGGEIDLAAAWDLQTSTRLVDPFVMVVERDGHWYVSAAYTVLEFLRIGEGLPEADFGSGRAARATLGADTPEAAAQLALDAAATADWETLLSLAPPDELPVYDYRAALAQLMRENLDPEFTVDAFAAQATRDGGRAVVDVRASGRTSSGDAWELRDGCLLATTSEQTEGGAVVPYSDGFCLGGGGALPYSFGYAADGRGDAAMRITAVERDGRWFVSPVGTVLDYVDTWVANFDERAFASLLGDFDALPVDGELWKGTPQRVESDGFGLMYAYTLQGTAGDEVVVEVRDAAGNPVSNVVYFVGPSGDDAGFSLMFGERATLPVTGTYRVVIGTDGTQPVDMTVHDADLAPDDVVNAFPDVYDNEQCTYDAFGGVSCIGYGSSEATTPTTSTDAQDIVLEGP
jgi:hypothetical protein